MIKITKDLIEKISKKAKDTPRRRINYNFHQSDSDTVQRFINAVADAGAECYRICDTVGIGLSSRSAPLPSGIPAKIVAIKAETQIENVEIHGHDDFGNAVENSLAAIRAASGVWPKIYASTTFLGIGERAGNAETEKVMLKS